MRIILFAVFSLIFAGCAQKGDARYYLPTVKELNSGSQKSVKISVSVASYLSGDKIWYLKEGVFLPYKSSYFAKTPKEFAKEALQNANLSGEVEALITDAYQSYDGENSSFILNVSISNITQSGKTYRKNLRIKKSGYKSGASEALKGFEACVEEMRAEAFGFVN